MKDIKAQDVLEELRWAGRIWGRVEDQGQGATKPLALHSHAGAVEGSAKSALQGKNDAREGVDVLGGSSRPDLGHPLPWPRKGLSHLKTMAYARKQTQGTAHHTVVPRLDICFPHPTVQVLDLMFDNEEWRVINFYHDV